jgi:hypothetical protein
VKVVVCLSAVNQERDAMTTPLVPSPNRNGALAPVQTVLPSGRTVQITLDGNEQIQVFAPGGELEVSLQFTDTGPVLRLRGARLELEAPEDIQVRCGKFAVQSREETTLHSDGNINITAGGEMRVKTDKATHIDGEMLYLNCEEEAEAGNEPT